MTESEKYVNTFSGTGKAVDNLERITSLLSALGNPQNKLRFIHIAGTNGKGSMAQMFNEILIHAGYRVGLFTSPYIIEYSDRIKVNNRNISPDELDDIVRQIRPIIDAHPKRGEFYQFEITQAVAFLYFVKCGCNVVVLETGVGGLLDSTNVIRNPVACVIGSVSYDHTAILGDTLEKIAFQKSGIIKPGCPCVLSPGNDEAVIRMVKEKAAKEHSPLIIPDLRDCRVITRDITGSEFSYKGEVYRTSMPGLHQVSNAVTVIEAMKFISESFPVTYENVSAGIKKARIFGRVEVLSKAPLVILDGAHNPDGMKALARSISSPDNKRYTIIIGMHKDKNSFEAVKNLIPLAQQFITVDGFSAGNRDLNKHDLARLIRKAGGNAAAAQGGIMEEIRRAIRENPDGGVLICGSLFLVSYVKTNSGKIF